MSVAGLLRDFFNWNRRLGDRIETWLGTGKPDFADEYNDLCASWITEHPGITVLDVGTGRRLTYAARLGSTERWIIGCDISKEEMRYNSAIDETIVSDASSSIPLSNASIDFLTSNYCIEHLIDVDRFLAEASRVLKRNGRLCVVFAGGYSLHAIINKILPHALARRVLYFFLPGSEVSQGFRAYYHLGTQKQFAQSLKVHGFQVKDIRYSFGSRGYFTFFLPCYLAVLLLDRLIAGINYTNWAADFIFIADKQTLPAPFHSRNEVGHA